MLSFELSLRKFDLLSYVKDIKLRGLMNILFFKYKASASIRKYKYSRNI